MTLEREDGWLTTNFDKPDIINSSIKDTVSSLQILNQTSGTQHSEKKHLNGNLHVPVHYLFNVSTVKQVLLGELSTALNCATYEITIKLQTAFHQKRKLKI